MLGEINRSNDDLSELIGLPAGDNGYTRTALLSLAGMKDLLGNIGLPLLKKEPFAFVNANTVAG